MSEEGERLRELMAREAQLHRPGPDTTTAELEDMIAGGFFEIGASGRRYERPQVLELLQRRLGDPAPVPWSTSDAACQQLGGSTWLLTYALDQRGRVTRRATLWRRTAQGWAALYHQGTLVQDG